MKKKITWLTASALCLVSLGVGVAASSIVTKIQAELRPDFTIMIDGEKQTFRNANGEIVEPILYEGTTYLPVRAIGELMGKTVYWYENEKRIELKTERSTVTDADVIVPSGANSTTDVTSDDGVSLDQAKEIVLKRAGISAAEATFVKEKMEYDDGRQVYDIEFWASNVKYSAEVLKTDGAIVSWKEKQGVQNGQTTVGTDIGLDKAKEIALQKAGISAADAVFIKAKLDYDDGRQVYDIEFRADGMEYSAEILTADGTVVSWDVDQD